MFLISKQWQLAGSLNILNNLLPYGEVELHEAVELYSNTELFHVNLVLAGEDEEIGIWTRFICSSQKAVVELIDLQKNYVDAEIWLQTRRTDPDGYSITAITEVIEMYHLDGTRRYEFKADSQISDCNEDGRYIDLPPITSSRTVYSTRRQHEAE